MITTYSERAYFTLEPCAHCAAHEEFLRLKWLRERSRRAVSGR